MGEIIQFPTLMSEDDAWRLMLACLEAAQQDHTPANLGRVEEAKFVLIRAMNEDSQ